MTKIRIDQLTTAKAWHEATVSGDPTDGLQRPKSVGYGIALAVGLGAMMFAASLAMVQSQQISGLTGCTTRAAVSPIDISGVTLNEQVVDAISRKSMYVCGDTISAASGVDNQATLKQVTSQDDQWPNQHDGIGRLGLRGECRRSALSAWDTPSGLRGSPCTALTPQEWVYPGVLAGLPVSPITIVVGTALLINLLGYSALVGLGVSLDSAPITEYSSLHQCLVIAGPVQGYLYSIILKYRRGQTKQVDERVRLLTDVIGSIRSVKVFGWERHFARKVYDMRQSEHKELRYYSFLRSTVDAVFFAIPVMATVCEFDGVQVPKILAG